MSTTDTPEPYFAEVDGFRAKEDLSHLSDEEITHRFINATVTLADRRDMGIADLLEAMLAAHLFSALIGNLLDDSLENENPVV